MSRAISGKQLVALLHLDGTTCQAWFVGSQQLCRDHSSGTVITAQGVAEADDQHMTRQSAAPSPGGDALVGWTHVRIVLV